MLDAGRACVGHILDTGGMLPHDRSEKNTLSCIKIAGFARYRHLLSRRESAFTSFSSFGELD